MLRFLKQIEGLCAIPHSSLVSLDLGWTDTIDIHTDLHMRENDAFVGTHTESSLDPLCLQLPHCSSATTYY